MKTLVDKKLSLILFLTVWVLYMVVFMTKNCYSAAMAAIVNEGALTKSQTGLINALFYIVYGPLQIIGGSMADRYSPAKLILTGVIGAALANTVIFINQSYSVMLVAWGLNAVAQFALWPSVLKIISCQLAKTHRQSGVFYISAASSVGVFVSFTIAALISKWQYNFLVSAILLFGVAFIFYIVYKYMQTKMVPDDEIKIETVKREQKISTSMLILKTGLLFMIPVSMFRDVLNTGIKAFSPVMLMESYTSVSPSVGNLLTLIVIFFGIMGIFVIKKYIYPKHIKDELKCLMLIFVLALPFTCVSLFIGKINLIIMVLLLSLICGLLSTSFLLLNYWTVKFHKMGCEGKVAGILNASASIGIVLESYGFAAIAERFSWGTVIATWIFMMVLSIALITSAKVVWKRFCKTQDSGI